MPGFSKTLKERFKTKWAKKQVGAGARERNVKAETSNLATRRIPVIEKRTRKSKKRSKEQKKRKRH